MEMNSNVHTAMTVAKKYADARSIVTNAGNALNQCFFLGWNLLTDEEKVFLRKAQNILDAIRERTGEYEAAKYVESLTPQNS